MIELIPSGRYRLGVLSTPDFYCAEGSVKYVQTQLSTQYGSSAVSKIKSSLPNCLFLSTSDISATVFCYAIDCLGAALLVTTGPIPFLVFLRSKARNMGMVLRHNGLYYGDNKVHGRTEAGIFQALCLPFINPVNRNVKGDWRTWKIPELK